MKLIVDTDMGIDDAIALLMVLAFPAAEVSALTSVMGNIPLAQATHNIGVVLDVAAAPLFPIYQGCQKPLLQYPPQHAFGFHGQDGLGGAGQPATDRSIAAEHASLALVRLAREQPGEVTLLTLGPLTNVALALRLDPNFFNNLRRLVIMGGAVEGQGNTSPSAEFNIAVDPEAARIVFAGLDQAQLESWLISWEASLIHDFGPAAWDELIAGESPIARFVQKMTVFMQQALPAANLPTFVWPDPLAAAVALDPEIVLTYEQRHVAVEIGSGLARGQTIVDYRPDSQIAANIRIVKQVNMQKFIRLLKSAFHGQAYA
jgi:purine nucleosidase